MERVTANSRNRRPTIPPMSKIGMNTATSGARARLGYITVNDISRLRIDQFFANVVHIEPVIVSRTAVTFGGAKCLTKAPRLCTPSFRYALRVWRAAVWMLMLSLSATSFKCIPFVRS